MWHATSDVVIRYRAYAIANLKVVSLLTWELAAIKENTTLLKMSGAALGHCRVKVKPNGAYIINTFVFGRNA